jgi:hypothetical protein
VKGGDGGLAGGGGGLGAGGAIFNAGLLVVENSTFDGNGAVGGNGNHCTGTFDDCFTHGPAGGGGGGFSGNGGEGSLYGGGGGGGALGNGGPGGDLGQMALQGGGGGGGGTLSDGLNGTGTTGGLGGFVCGGQGGDAGSDAQGGTCDGGGGGGGGVTFSPASVLIADIRGLMGNLKAGTTASPITGYAVSNGLGVPNATVTLVDSADAVVTAARTLTPQNSYLSTELVLRLCKCRTPSVGGTPS